MQKKGN